MSITTTVVDLGRIIVRRTQPTTTTTANSLSSSLSLTLSTSCVIDLPSAWLGAPDTERDSITDTTASEIAKACREGSLWIAKAGSCQLDFSIVLPHVDHDDDDEKEGELLDDCGVSPGREPKRSIIDETTLSRVSGLIADCPVWQDIGLQLRDRHSYPSESRNDDDGDGLESIVGNIDIDTLSSSSSYFLHHPDLSSDIHAPPSVPCAKFRGLTCQIKLLINDDDLTTSQPSRRQKRPTNAIKGGEQQGEKETTVNNETPIEAKVGRKKRRIRKVTQHTAQHHGYNLRRAPRPSSKARGELVDVEDLGEGAVLGNGATSSVYHDRGRGGEGGRSSKIGKKEEAGERKKKGEENFAGGGSEEGYFYGQTVLEQVLFMSTDAASHVDIVEEVGELLDVGLRGLIGVGGRRRGSRTTKGVKVVRQEAGIPSLIDIAPAVWNLRYLQSVTAHAKLIPSLATSIARLKNSKSLRLRKKLQKLVDKKETPGREVSDEITQRLWRLCQTGIRASPFSKGNNGGNVRRELPSRTISYRNVETHDHLSLDFQQTPVTMFPVYWEGYGEYMMPPPPGPGLYGDFAGVTQMEYLHSGMDIMDPMDPMDGDDFDSGSGSGSDVWQAEWLAPHDFAFSEEDGSMSEERSYCDFDREPDKSEDSGIQSSEIGDGERNMEEEEEEEDSIGEYFYADGYGNVFPIGFGDGECDEEEGYHVSDGSEWEGSGEGEEEEEIGELDDDHDGHGVVGRYPIRQELWDDYHRTLIESNTNTGYW